MDRRRLHPPAAHLLAGLFRLLAPAVRSIQNSSYVVWLRNFSPTIDEHIRWCIIRNDCAPRTMQTPLSPEVTVKRITVVRIFLYLSFFLAMLFSGWSLGTPIKTRAEYATCCSFGEDCKKVRGAPPSCCLPGAFEADCSASKKNYCREPCQ